MDVMVVDDYSSLLNAGENEAGLFGDFVEIFVEDEVADQEAVEKIIEGEALGMFEETDCPDDD